jgi:HAE1 family hydrophobic/amphiphilic exporter-1
MFLNWEYVGTDKMRRAYIQQVMAGMDLPYGYAVEEATQEFFTQEEEEDLRMAVILAVVFIYMVLAALFESASLPLLVLTSLPMALTGVFLAFWLMDSTFDSSARIGLVLLFGIVVNNAILLVSRFRTECALVLKARLGGDPEAQAGLFPGLKKRLGGTDLYRLPPAERAGLLRRAVARGTRVRLRSILLTSGTTIVGLAPLLIRFGESEGQDIWENLALSSIGGLVSSTVLLLLAMPALYYVSIRVKWIGMRFWYWVRRRKPETLGLPEGAEA